MDKLGSTESPFPKLSSDEIMELEGIYKEMREKVLSRKSFQEMAKRFSSSSNGAGKTSLSWRQVWQWFKSRQSMSLAKDVSSSDLLKMSADLAGSSLEKGELAADMDDLAYEARSSKDIAWHDVAMFLNYRNLSTGELEVRVRYAGFGKEQDEWINVELGVRERSVPLEPSECHKVKDGDLVLCFLEREDYALYCDARLVTIERRIHDTTECTCTFIVRFLHDSTEEALSWNKVCCRPTQEESLDPTPSPSGNLTLNTIDIESLWG